MTSKNSFDQKIGHKISLVSAKLSKAVYRPPTNLLSAERRQDRQSQALRLPEGTNCLPNFDPVDPIFTFLIL